MGPVEPGLVDIVRDFLATYEIAGRGAARFRAGELAFDEVQHFVADNEDSALFRLKERCHALFRSGDAAGPRASRGALFDLAVGALFHEAMKFRETFYQQSVYGPKMRAMPREADADTAELFGEFEKILAATSVRLAEALQETEALLEQTRRQFRRLLVAHRENGLVTRYLVENAPLVQAVFEDGLEALLEEMYGSTGEGYVVATRSYLASGYFEEAQRALDEAQRRLGRRPDLDGLRAYVGGMSAYLDGRGSEALECLAAWLEAPEEAMAEPFADLAYDAVSRLADHAAGQDRAVAERAGALAERLERLSPGARNRRPHPEGTPG
jgi:hypothetical protein